MAPLTVVEQQGHMIAFFYLSVVGMICELHDL